MESNYRICTLNDLYLENAFRYINLLRLGRIRYIVSCGVLEEPYKPQLNEMRKLRSQDVLCLTKPDSTLQANFLDEAKCLEILGRKRLTIIDYTKKA